jgi:hypothetical protein
MDRFLNLPLMAHPLNWVTIFLMCALALMLLALISPTADATADRSGGTVGG